MSAPPPDVACSSPDQRSIVTYLSMFLEFQSEADEVSVCSLEPPIVSITGSSCWLLSLQQHPIKPPSVPPL